MSASNSQYDSFSCHPLYDEAFKLTSVLTRAITCQAVGKVKYLLEKGCNPNAPAGRKKVRPLMVACYVSCSRKRIGIFRALVHHGASPFLTDVYGRNSVMYACALALRDEVELLVKDCDYDLNAKDRYGDTALHMCAKAGDVRVLGVLLKEMQRHRMDLSVQNRSHLTPLSLAVSSGNYECAKMLHEAGGCPRYHKCQFPSELGECGRVRETPVAWDSRTTVASVASQKSASSQSRGRIQAPSMPLRGQQKIPRLFSRVRVESASDICKSHSGKGNPDSWVLPRAEILKEAALNKQQSGSESGVKTQSARVIESVSTTSSHPVTSMDCINAILSSPVYNARLSVSFNQPPRTLTQVDSEWLAVINTYKKKAEEVMPKRSISSPVGVKQRITSSGTSSSSSASSSRSQLFRNKVLKHAPRLFKTKMPLMKIPFPKDECIV